MPGLLHPRPRQAQANGTSAETTPEFEHLVISPTFGAEASGVDPANASNAEFPGDSGCDG